MQLALRKCDSDDWFIIEKMETPGTRREWYESFSFQCGDSIINGERFMHSARLSDADVEGTAREMLEIADAIHYRRDENFKRCAVEFRSVPLDVFIPKEGYNCDCEKLVYFFSPRNTNDPVSPVSLKEADDLAKLIRGTLENK